MSTKHKLKLVNHTMFLVMMIVFFIFFIKVDFIQSNDKFEYTPTESSLNFVSYEDYKTFEKVTKTLDIQYTFSSVPDKTQFIAINIILYRDNQINENKFENEINQSHS